MSTKPVIEFFFDVGSPNAYLSHLVLPNIANRLETTILYTPILLGGIFKATGNVSPAVSLANIPSKMNYGQRETARFVAKHGLENVYHWNPDFPINTVLLMRILTAAQQRDGDFFRQATDCIFNALWRDPVKLDEEAPLREALASGGFPVDELLAAAVTQENKQRLIDATGRAVALGVFGAPSFTVGDELFFGKDKLRDVEEEFLRQAGQTS